MTALRSRNRTTHARVTHDIVATRLPAFSRQALHRTSRCGTLQEDVYSSTSHTLMVFQGQGHGFSGDSGRTAADATWEFFDRHLKP